MKTLLKNPIFDIKPRDGDLEEVQHANSVLHYSKKVYRKLYNDLLGIKKSREKRNRERGPLFFTIGLSISLFLTIIALNWRSYDNQGIVDLGKVEGNFDEIMDVPISNQPPPPPPKKLENFNIKTVDDKTFIEDMNINLDVELTEDLAVKDVVYEDIPILEAEEEKVDEIFLVVEDQAQFPGGIGEFYKYVAESIVYPETAKRLNISGRVFVRFVVEKDGNITQVSVVRGIGGGCDAEAARVIQNSPKWIPAKQRGRPVRVYMTVPINFTLRMME